MALGSPETRTRLHRPSVPAPEARLPRLPAAGDAVMARIYEAQKYLDNKKSYEAAQGKHHEAEQELRNARDAFVKSRDKVRAVITEEQLTELVVQSLRDEVNA